MWTSVFSAFNGGTSTTSTSVAEAQHTILFADASDKDCTIISLKTAELISTPVITEQGLFTLLTIPGMGQTTEIGKPQLPFLSGLVAVPNSQIEYEIVNLDYYNVEVDRIYPAQEPHADGYQSEDIFAIEESVYSSDAGFPGELVKILDSGIIRAIPFARIGFYPVQYNPNDGIARVYTIIQIKITWDNNVNFEIDDRLNSQHFEAFYENSFINWKDFKKAFSLDLHTPKARSTTGCEYLIITDIKFVGAANNLSAWKNEKGIDTRVVTTITSGTGGNTLKQYIVNAFFTWNPAPSYILFIGDAEYIQPLYENIHPYYGSYTGTDLWYMTLIGPDYYPDVFYGRIPVDTAFDATNYVNKIINYETNPTYNPWYYNNITVSAYFQDDDSNGYEDRRFVRTSEETRDFLRLNLTDPYDVARIYCTSPSINPTHYNDGTYGNGEPLPADLLRPLFAWDGDAADINNRINNGTFIMNHRDHGSRDGWGDPSYHISEIGQLNNDDLLPVVFSINCETGWFDEETDSDGGTTTPCFCEEFVRKVNGGCVCIFGATRVSYSGYNDYMFRGFYDAIWPEYDQGRGSSVPMYKVGEVMNNGKSYMANSWGDSWGYEELEFEIFHVYGDPTMEIWTSEPMNLTVSHQSIILVNSTKVIVNVSQDDAFVSLAQNGVIIGTNYSSGGFASVDTSPLTVGYVNITVTKHNYRPYRGNLTVIIGTPPEVDLTSPDGGELFAGGSATGIQWEMSDEQNSLPQLVADIYYSTDGGLTYPNLIATGLTGFTSNPCVFYWNPLPTIDSNTMKVRVEVIDTESLSDKDDSAGSFSIDSTAPMPATNVRAELTGVNDVTIYWTASSSLDVAYYQVYYILLGTWDPTGESYSSTLASTVGTSSAHAGAGNMTNSEYCYQVRTFDLTGHEARSIIQAAKFTKLISASGTVAWGGWIPLGSSITQSSYALSHKLQGQGFGMNGFYNWSAVELYNAWDNADHWKFNLRNGTSGLNEFGTINNTQGFWTCIYNNARYTSAGYISNLSLPLKAGWNLVPYPFAVRNWNTMQIRNHLIANCPSFGGTYNDMEIANKSASYRLGTPSGSEILTHQDAFWVRVTTDTAWTVVNY